MLDNITLSTIKLFLTLIFVGVVMTYYRNNQEKVSDYLLKFQKNYIVSNTNSDNQKINNFISEYFISEE